MSSVDDRIVNMQFNNRQFTTGVTDSQRSLASLNDSLARTATSGGLNDMASSVETVSTRFGALKIAGVAAIATIASKATTIGLGMIKSLTLDPLTQGFQEYQTNLNSIQTILANTPNSLKEVNAALADLNHYSDSTIYNFGQMAASIGKFTAAGVPLGAATSAIKGMANSAALSGASVDQLNSAMYQMSQALASGTIRLMDWNSLVNANMGGVNMQKSLEATAMTMKDNGAAFKDATAGGVKFRDSLQAGWLSADIFSKTMKVMGGQTLKTTGSVKSINKQLLDIGYTSKEAAKVAPELKKTGATIAFTTQQLEKMGYSKEAAKRLSELSSEAIHSAQDIKTLPQLLDVVKEAIGSGWAKLSQDIFGNFKQSKELWTSVGTTIQGTIGQIFGAVDAMLVGWRKLGGYTELWASFGNIFKALGNVLHPVIALFAAITPGTAKAGAGLYSVTHAVYLFTGWIEKASEGVRNLTPLFKDVGRVIGAVAGQFKGLNSLGSSLAPIFDKLGGSISGIASQGMSIAKGLLDGIISGLSGSAIKGAIVKFATSIIDWIKGALGIHSPSTEAAKIGVNVVEGLLVGLEKSIPIIFTALGKIAFAIVHGIAGLFTGFTATDFASLLNAIFTTGLILALTRGVNAVTGFKTVLGTLKTMIIEVGNSLKVWQQSLKAKIILDIAIAVGILVAALVILGLLNPKQIGTGLGAIAAMMTLLVGTMAALSKISAKTDLLYIAGSISAIAAAMLLFSAAIILLGKQDMKTLEKGIGAIVLVLGALVIAMKAMSGIEGSLAAAGAGMVLMAVAINVLVSAIFLLGQMDMSTLAKGLGAMAIGLSLMTDSLVALGIYGKNAVKSGAALVLVAAAINIMAAAVFLLGSMNMKTLVQGMIAMGIGLGLMTGALVLLSGVKGVFLAAAGMVLMATAMNMMVSVILILGAAPWDVVARGLVFVAAALAIFLLAGAAAMAVAPGLEVLGSSILLVGAAMWLAGTGMAAFAAGFALMAATGVAGTVVIIGFIHALLAILPEIAVQAAASFIAFLKVIANASVEVRSIMGKLISTMIGVLTDNIPKIVGLAVTFISELLKGIRQLIPEFGKLINVLIKTGLDIISKAVPRYITAGLEIILGVLKGLNNNLPKIIKVGGELIVSFIEGLGTQGVKIANATGKTILDFLDGLDKAIVKYQTPIMHAGEKIAWDIGLGLFNGLGGSYVWGLVKSAVENLAGAMPGWMKKVLGIASPSKVFMKLGEAVGAGAAAGIVNSTAKAVQAVIAMANSIVAAGNKAVLQAQKSASAIQGKAYAAGAKAEQAAEKARDAARYARQHKKDKEAQKRAKQLQKQADHAQHHADTVQSSADKAAQHVQDVQTFQQADLHGKGDIKDQQAVALANRAQKMLADANAEAARGRELMKTNRKAGRALLDQARKDAKEAKDLADRARQSHKDAQAFYAQEVNDRIKAMRDTARADKEAADWQAKFDAASTQGQSDLLNNRAAELEAKAAGLKADAARYTAKAKALAKTNAAAAMLLLDKADAASAAAQEAADAAAQDRDQAQQLVTDSSSGTGDTSGGTSATSIAPSRSVLEDAAKAVDRYTESLMQATAAAAADQSVVQFVQNNTSPVALSPSEVYRLSKNLLSAAELKMGVKANN